MSHWATFKQTATNLWVTLRHDILALAVFLNGLLIFKTIYGMSVNLLDIFHIKAFSELISPAGKRPTIYARRLSCPELHWLTVPGKARMGNQYHFVVDSANLHPAFLSWLKFSIGFCIFTLVFLLILRKDFSHSSAAAGTIFAFISFTTLLFYSTYGALYLSEGFNPRIESLMTAFYFSIETMSTVGYGDIVPVSESARLFTISVIISGITVFATSMTSIFGPLIRGGFNKLVKGNNHTMHRKDHFIVCGHSILAINTILQLNQRGQNVTVISNLPEDDIKQLEQRLGDNADVIPGDSNDSSVLKKAGIDRCRAILALSDNDADNAFVVLSAKDMSSDVKTVLAVSDSKNLNKIKMVHPDIILSPQLFGSEILARVLNGEEINNDMLVSMLLNSGHGIFSDNDEQETKADSKESAQK